MPTLQMLGFTAKIHDELVGNIDEVGIYQNGSLLSQFNQEIPILQMLGFTAKIHDEL
ncbi:MAG TPA: hypothetical protein VK184_16690 [Nostocaceae cyanobacterium]|nr:hypothetical protein [Nostocaceae cyanobacterium]